MYLQESVRTFKDLIVVHNLRTITDEQALWHQWRQQVTDMYGEGEEVKVGVAVPGAHPNSPMRMVQMSWFRTHSVRHLCHLWPQPPSPMAAAPITYGCSPHHLWLQPPSPMVAGAPSRAGVTLFGPGRAAQPSGDHAAAHVAHLSICAHP